MKEEGHNMKKKKSVTCLISISIYSTRKKVFRVGEILNIFFLQFQVQQLLKGVCVMCKDITLTSAFNRHALYHIDGHEY